MWTSPPISIRTLRLDDGSEKPQCLIVVYTESTVDIYDGFKGTWMQSINAKRVSPLESSSAQLSIHSGDDELKRLCILHFEANSEEIHLPQKIRPNARRNLQKLGKRKFVYKSANAERSKVPQIQVDYSWTLPVSLFVAKSKKVEKWASSPARQSSATLPTWAQNPAFKWCQQSRRRPRLHQTERQASSPAPRISNMFITTALTTQIRGFVWCDWVMLISVFSSQSLQSTERSLLTSRTSLIRSTNSSELSEKSPVQSNSIEKRYARRSGYFPED